MSDEHGLLAAILAHPDEDTPRLVYADWLDENDQPERAEFIRVQVKLATMDDAECWTENMPFGTQCTDPDCPWEVREWLRERELALYPGDRLYPPGSWSDYDYITVTGWSRGFVDHVTCAAGDWITNGYGDYPSRGDAILAAQPVREVTLTTAVRVNDFEDVTTQDGPTARRCLIAGEWVEVADWRGVVSRDPWGLSRAVLSLRWPRVKVWNLPAARAEADQTTRLFDEHVDGMRREIIRRLVGPPVILAPRSFISRPVT